MAHPADRAPSAAGEAVAVADGLARHYRVRQGLFAPPAVLKALDGVSFTLQAARTLAVVGESGCGKSTLARLVTLIDKPTAGTLRIAGQDAIAPSPPVRRQLRRAVHTVFQNPYGSLNPRKTIGAIIEEPLAVNTGLGRVQRRDAVREMMAKVGLRPEHYDRYPHMFSGGQRQRIAIARSLMLRPKLVVADEPVSALDVSIQAQVLNLLKDLQQEFGLSYLFISHDLAVVRHIADEILVMYLGRGVEQGTKERIFAQPLHPYTRALLAATPGMTGNGPRRALTGELPSPLNPPKGCAFSTRCPHVAERCRIEPPAPRSIAGRLVACHEAERLADA
ncbi:dipeptide ABC transporter ATP-binding protein [Rhodovastum sp. RN2-1]|uniref:Dipeptide ABC transporter ATP-binding protein n=1 Tax=Limobrevibacterium gyesilva TaxID=2991712 RepID=A0AA41YQ92_9PROT|nr:dipeptide ABC transporter ATP-binding protein [Limobrevibacterium gyesilva]